MTADMTGRVALVTGAGRGIGREIALGLATAGAKVALRARSTSELQAVASEIRSADGTALELVTDVSDPAPLHGVVARVVSRLGAISVLINNAAVVGPLGATRALEPVEIGRSLTANHARGELITARQSAAALLRPPQHRPDRTDLGCRRRP